MSIIDDPDFYFAVCRSPHSFTSSNKHKIKDLNRYSLAIS
jgi:hypothetical protein